MSFERQVTVPCSCCSIVAAFQSRFTFSMYKYTKRILVGIVGSFHTAFEAWTISLTSIKPLITPPILKRPFGLGCQTVSVRGRSDGLGTRLNYSFVSMQRSPVVPGPRPLGTSEDYTTSLYIGRLKKQKTSSEPNLNTTTELNLNTCT